MIDSCVFSRESDEAPGFAGEIDYFLKNLIECLQRYHDRMEEEGDFLKVLKKCVERTGKGNVFILNGDQNICEYPGAILIVPELSSESILQALNAAETCSSMGHPIGGIVFFSKGSVKKFEESLSLAWRLFLRFGVMALGVLQLLKQTTTRWILGWRIRWLIWESIFNKLGYHPSLHILPQLLDARFWSTLIYIRSNLTIKNDNGASADQNEFCFSKNTKSNIIVDALRSHPKYPGLSVLRPLEWLVPLVQWYYE